MRVRVLSNHMTIVRDIERDTTCLDMHGRDEGGPAACSVTRKGRQADAIVALARDRELLREMGTKARRRVEEFSLSACAERWRDAVDGAVATLGGGHAG